MCRFTPRIRPRRRDTTSTLAPAALRARSGTTSSTFSKPSAARTAILRPLSRRRPGISFPCRRWRSDLTGCPAVGDLPAPGRRYPRADGAPAHSDRHALVAAQDDRAATERRSRGAELGKALEQRLQGELTLHPGE